ncbi:MAG: hypothetical protein HY812_19120 [Planctomycetes bacterium]|nr:hypothetical protein [Planctomycetota bacterium]
MVVFMPPPPPPSRRAVELGERLTELLRESLKRDPNLNARDVRQALHIAAANLRRDEGGLGATVIAALGAGVLVLAGLLFFVQRGGGRFDPGQPLLLGGVVLLVSLFVVVVILMRR